jgi:two-component system LytT family response regulator
VNSAVELIRKVKPDVVFLDIEMPGKSGLQLLDELPRDEVHYEIIFTTAFNDYALKGFSGFLQLITC